MTKNTDTTAGESALSTTRRAALAALGGGAVASALTGDADAQSVGGSDADAASQFLSRLYAGQESEIPEPVDGRTRFWHVTSGGSTYDEGDLLIEGSTSWSRLDLGVGQLTSDSVNTEVGSFNERYAASFSGSDMGLKTQAALDDLNGKGVVYLPAGSYTVSSTILLSEGQYLVGAGADATVLELAAGANTNLIEFSNGGYLGIFGGVRDLQLDGNRANNSSGHAIYSNGDIIDGKLYNCFVDEVADDCVHLEASASRWMVAHNHL